MSTVKL